MPALASSIGCDLEAVAAQLHAAPASRPLFAGVMEVQYTLIALADTIAIHIGEQNRRTVRQGGKQVFGLVWFEPPFRRRRVSLFFELGADGVLCHQSIQFIHSGVMNSTSTLQGEDLLTQSFPQRAHGFQEVAVTVV